MAIARPSTTPNPNAMKFTLDVTLAERIDTTRGDGVGSSLTGALLAIDGVASVFGVNDFITITRHANAGWDPIVCAVESAVETHLTDEPAGSRAVDEVVAARRLLRNAVAPPPSISVDISRRPQS